MTSSNYKSWLTSKLVLSHLTYFIVPILVLEYRPNRSVDDAVIVALHLRLLFMDFSYAFNTILPAGLQDKISQSNSRKHVRLVCHGLDFQWISTASPPGFVLYPLHISLYTNSCTSNHHSIKLPKFAVDTTLSGLTSGGVESGVTWSSMLSKQ